MARAVPLPSPVFRGSTRSSHVDESRWVEIESDYYGVESRVASCPRPAASLPCPPCYTVLTVFAGADDLGKVTTDDTRAWREGCSEASRRPVCLPYQHVGKVWKMTCVGLTCAWTLVRQLSDYGREVPIHLPAANCMQRK